MQDTALQDSTLHSGQNRYLEKQFSIKVSQDPFQATSLGSPSVEFIGAIAQLVGACLFVPIWLRFSTKLDLEALYQVAFPLVATAFLLMPFFDSLYRECVMALACFAFGIVSILMQLTCIRIYERT